MENFLPIVPYVLTFLWSLICLRIYTMISVENAGQRRMIAIGGAIGAALIFILAANFVTILQAPTEEPPQKDDGRIKVQMKS
jgi:hypothetical protein